MSAMKTSTFCASVQSAAVIALVAIASPAQAQTADGGTKTLIDYFLPTPILCPLTSNTWGAASVLPRDTCNGLEDTTGLAWDYWDGIILKNTDGTFHIFAGRWPATKGFNDWPNSVGVHAVSNDTYVGSYIASTAATFTSGKEQNVTGIVLNDGSYALIDSPGNIFTATNLGGPWTTAGTLTINANGYTIGTATENQSLWEMATGNFLIAPRPFYMMLSTTGILGPYLIQGGSVLPTIPGVSGQAEDPVIWCSGGQFHMVANWWSERKAMHLTSNDGIHNWTNRGLAYDPTTNFVRYTDGTVNNWYNMERPGVYMEKGHVVAFSFAVTDVEKTTIVAGDNHLSKIIVVPFDGATFDAENPGPGSAECPLDTSGPDDAGGGDANERVDAGGLEDASEAVDAASAMDASRAADGSPGMDASRAQDGAGLLDASRGADAAATDAALSLDATRSADGSITAFDAAVQADASAPAQAAADANSSPVGQLDAQGGSDDEGGVMAGGSSPDGGTNAGGCSCQTAGVRGENGLAGFALLAGLLLAAGRRRRTAPTHCPH
jgi:MYXO-CTERM domain-containing protein